MANPDHVELVKQGAEAIARWRGENLGVRLDLGEADLGGADLYRTNVTRAHLNEVRGLEHVYNLETVRFTSAEDTQDSPTPTDAAYFETYRRPWPERWFDWEHLRVVGRLLLFGASYTALILIPIVFYALAVYNDKVELVQAGADEIRLEAEQMRTWADQVAALPDHPIYSRIALLVHRGATLVDRLTFLAKNHLHSHPIPSLSLVLLASTILLAVGSTLYTFRCPSRIKEFSRDQ